MTGMVNEADNVQLVPLRELLASTLEAAIGADMATMRRYYDNLCEITFEDYDAQNRSATRLRMLTLNYNMEGTVRQIHIPVLSLVPLPMLQMKNIRFGMDAALVSVDDKEDGGLQLYVSIAPQSSVGGQDTDGAKAKCSIKMEIEMEQADMPGGMARLLQMVNNMNY